jgi:hypothetical protein
MQHNNQNANPPFTLEELRLAFFAQARADNIFPMHTDQGLWGLIVASVDKGFIKQFHEQHESMVKLVENWRSRQLRVIK